MVSKIRIGVGVSAAIGPLIDDPNLTQETVDSNNRRARRHRERYTGVVVASVSERLWRVYWDQTGAISDHPGLKLKYMGRREISPEVLRLLTPSEVQNVQDNMSERTNKHKNPPIIQVTSPTILTNNDSSPVNLITYNNPQARNSDNHQNDLDLNPAPSINKNSEDLNPAPSINEISEVASEVANDDSNSDSSVDTDPNNVSVEENLDVVQDLQLINRQDAEQFEPTDANITQAVLYAQQKKNWLVLLFVKARTIKK